MTFLSIGIHCSLTCFLTLGDRESVFWSSWSLLSSFECCFRFSWCRRWRISWHQIGKGFFFQNLLLVLAVPACYLPWARVLLLPLILVGAYWISIFWIFFTCGFSCASRASGGVKVPRKSGSQPSIEQPALAPRSSNNKEQPASLSSSSNDQLPTDYPSSSIAAEPSPSLRLNGSPRPCSKGKVISLNRARDIRRKRMTRWKKSPFSPPIYL